MTEGAKVVVRALVAAAAVVVVMVGVCDENRPKGGKSLMSYSRVLVQIPTYLRDGKVGRYSHPIPTITKIGPVKTKEIQEAKTAKVYALGGKSDHLRQFETSYSFDHLENLIFMFNLGEYSTT